MLWAQSNLSDYFEPVFSAVLASYCVIAAGFILRRTGWLSKDAQTRFLFVTVNLFMPCFIFYRIVLSGTHFELRNAILPPIFGAVSIIIGILIARGLAGLLPASLSGLETRSKRNTFAACVGNLNYGFVPIPLIAHLFPEDESLFGVLLMQNLGVELCIWTITIFVIIGQWQKGLWKRAINGPTCAIVISAALSLLMGSGYFPEPFKDGLSHLAFLKIAIKMFHDTAIPMSMFLVGCTISDYLDISRIRCNPAPTFKVAFWGALLRIGVLPAIMIFVAVALPDTIMSLEMRKVMIIHGGMASAVFPIVLCEIYGGEPTIALDVVLSNSFISLLTTPLWVAFGLKMLSG